MSGERFGELRGLRRTAGGRVVRSLRVRGALRTAERLAEEADDRLRRWLTGRSRYEAWYRGQLPDARRAAELREAAARWPRQPLISVLLPACDTDPRWLRRALASVFDQIYPVWELVAVDDASSRPEVWRTLRAAARDSRVQVARQERRSGISAATNAALRRARGEHVALLDHDDELSSDALLWVARKALEEPFDVLYSDEDKITESGRLRDPAFKPDYSPDLLRACNYFGHLTVIRAELAWELGGFRSEYDGSQDYDMVLRAVERARRIVHVPRVLYHWRITPGSAADPGAAAKPWAYAAARRALEAHLARTHAPAAVEEGFDWSYRRVRYAPPPPRSVSLVVDGPPDGVAGLRERSETRVACEVLGTDGGSQPVARGVAERCNEAAARARGDVLVFLASGRMPAQDGWLEELASQALRPEVGMVGARIVSESGRLLHIGVVLGGPESVRCQAPRLHRSEPGMLGINRACRNASAVSGGCLAVRRELFQSLGGFDTRYHRSLHDVDLCLRGRERGLWVVYDAHVELRARHSRLEPIDPQDLERFAARWKAFLEVPDPYSSPAFADRGPVYQPAYRMNGRSVSRVARR